LPSKCRNGGIGLRGCLKSICPKGHAGSSPASGTHDEHGEIVGARYEHGPMYPLETVQLARLLSDLEFLDRENASICSVSVRAIRHWRAGDRRVGTKRLSAPTCPRCHGRVLNDEAYAYLLGLYLGDGHITRGRRTHVLWLACSDAWPGLLALAKQTMTLVMPSSSVFCASQRGVACTYVKGRVQDPV
jgi:hypothetical protein